jgi:urease accessory protein
MRRAREVRPAGQWDPAAAHDRVVLSADDRHRRRLALTTESGADVLLDLAEATVLHDGDGLVLDDGTIIRVAGLPEPLADLAVAASADLVRIAWHLGNRHAEVEFAPGRLRIRRDHVLEAMAEQLGATVSLAEAPFSPEPPAPGRVGHDHGGDHAR